MGSQPSRVRARVMSGRRRMGSSWGSGLKTISDFEPVTARTSWAHSRMVHSTGLPMLTGSVLAGAGEAHDAVDEVRDEAEGAGLRAVAVDGEGLAAQGLHHEVGDDAAVVGLQARAVGVEDADEVGVDDRSSGGRP